MKIYQGVRTPEGNIVTVDGVDLPHPPMPQDVVETRDWEWGHSGTGPLRLAKAILLDFFQDNASARRLAPAFLKVIETLPEEEFELTEDEIADWVKKKTGGMKFGWRAES